MNEDNKMKIDEFLEKLERKNRIETIIGITSILISLGIITLVILALIKYIRS